MKGSLAALALVALLTGLAKAADSGTQQTFWEISTGPAPAPYPTPTYWPVDWYGSWYYPTFWPICTPPQSHHCRPLHGRVWPPPLRPGQHPVPRPMPMSKPPR